MWQKTYFIYVYIILSYVYHVLLQALVFVWVLLQSLVVARALEGMGLEVTVPREVCSTHGQTPGSSSRRQAIRSQMITRRLGANAKLLSVWAR